MVRMSTRNGCFVVVVLLAHFSAVSAAEDGQVRSMFSRFSGVCQAGTDPNRPQLWKHLSAIRDDLSWSAVQPEGPDDWNMAYLEQWGRRVLEDRKMGVELVPMLGYMAPWAARRRAWSFEFDGVRYDVAAREGDEPPDVTVTDLASGQTHSTKFSLRRMPPENVADWERFVERVVEYLSAAPYHVKYFQPWNEADDRFTGFWQGGMDEYMTTIHLPAARAIRKHGGKVVYGGYPCSGHMRHFIDACERHQAWDTLDVLDIHYFPLSSWDYLYKHVVAPGKVWGLWQTEIGFTQRTDWVPNTYPRFFHWAISHDWEPDRYKIFHFAYGSPDDPKAYGYRRCLLSSNKLNCHGRALVTLGELLDGPQVRPYTHWKTRPHLRTQISERTSSVEGFDTGERIVLAIHLAKENEAAIFTDWEGSGDNMHLDWPSTRMTVTLTDLSAADVRWAGRVGIYGSKRPVDVVATGDGVALSVPVMDEDAQERADNRASPVTTFYVVVERAAAGEGE